ncbi:MAG: hypothetical protein AAGF76_07730 [Pseudomonadota bacterium]
MSKPTVPNFEQAMELLTHAEAEIRRGDTQAQALMTLNALLAGTGAAGVLGAGGALGLVVALSGLGALALGTIAIFHAGTADQRQMKDARQALYLDAIGERDTYAEFVRSFTLLSASPGERVLHAVYLRSLWARRKKRLVRLLGQLSLLNIAAVAVMAVDILAL